MASITQVAKAAGVSISTVSYALSGKRSIGEQTRARVLEAADALGYRAHAGARMLAGSRTQLLALTAPLRADTSTPAHMAFVLAVVSAARHYDYDVVLLTEDEAMDGLRRVVSSKLVDGVVVLDVGEHDDRLNLLRELDAPSALVGVPADPKGLMCVDLDFEAAARLAVNRLADAGHRRLVLLGEPRITYERGANFPTRFRRAAADAAAVRQVDCRVVESGLTRGDLDALDSALTGPDRATALLMQCAEPTQRAAIDRASDLGLSIPGDLSAIAAAVTFDTATFTTPIDAIPLLPSAATRRAVELLMGMLDGEPSPARVELLTPSWVEHGSVAPLGAI